MRDFFRGWKRKIGVITLVLACVFAAAWVRNRSAQESLNLPTGHTSSLLLASGCDGLNFVAISTTAPDQELATFHYFREAASAKNLRLHCGEIELNGTPESFRPVQYGVGGKSQRRTITLFSVPYWSIVIPLTVLSAWLLLSKRRERSAELEPPIAA